MYSLSTHINRCNIGHLKKEKRKNCNTIQSYDDKVNIFLKRTHEYIQSQSINETDRILSNTDKAQRLRPEKSNWEDEPPPILLDGV